MDKNEIIELGTKLGLRFDEKTNYPDALEKGRVVFDGANGQRFLFEESMTEDEVLERMGESLQLMGRRQLKVDFNRLMSQTSDF